MESSEEEEDIINNDEDDYGEFLQQAEISKNKKKVNNIMKNLKIINDYKNLSTEKDELTIKREIKRKEITDKNKNIINKNKIDPEKVKRKNLMIMTKVIDLNINQNRNKKFIQEVNLLKIEKKNNNNNCVKKEKSEGEEDENENCIGEKEENNIFNNKEKEKNTAEKQEEKESFPIKEHTQSKINNDKKKEVPENEKENYRNKINFYEENNIMKNKNEPIKDEENGEDEEVKKKEATKNKLINQKIKNNENIQIIKEKKKNENSDIISEKKDKKHINLNENIKQNEDNNSKNQELSDKINNEDIIVIKEDGKIIHHTKNISGYKTQDNYEKDRDESIIFKEKIEFDKNFIMQSKEKENNQINNYEFFQDLHQEKSFEQEQLKENQNAENKIKLKSRNKTESSEKQSPKKIYFKNNGKGYECMKSETPKRREEHNIIYKNNKLKDINISTNFSNDIKEKFFSTTSFSKLLGNRSFRRFLNNKLEQSKNTEDEVPKKFIENLSLKVDQQVIDNNKKENKTNDSTNYSLFYNEDNYQIPLNKKYRKTVNEPYNFSKMNNIHEKLNIRYENDISMSQYDNLKESINKIEPHRFTIAGYNHFKENISELNLKNQKLHDTIIELQNQIRASKNEINLKNSELQKYYSSYDKISLENNLNKEKIDELKRELKLQKGKMNEKESKISELENINSNLKNEMAKLQKNYDAETTINKETKQNYDLIKSNYNDIKNQYDLLNIKYQTLTDENFNFKRDKALYERQIKTKNQMIESLMENKSNLFNNNNLYKLDSIEEKEESNHEMYLDYIKNKNISNEMPKKEEKDNGMKKVKDDKEQNGDIDYSKYDKLTYPELQSKRDELVNERKNINNIFSKIPLKSNYKGQAEKRNELEKKINEINLDLAIIKLRMKNLKNLSF